MIRKDTVEIHSSSISRITNFLNFPSTRFVSSELSSNKSSTVTDHLDAFFFSDLNTYDCFRFNAATNKSMELFTANKSDDYFFVNISRDYKEYINISRDEYYQYTFYYSRLYVYITDNFLNSFDKVEPLILDTNYRHDIEIEKQSIEIKLPGPYNECKELLVDEHFHQSNCMSNCIYREIYKNYNCSFPLVLFPYSGLRRCRQVMSFYKNVSSQGCLKECPLENCYTEKFSHYVTSEIRIAMTQLKFSFRDFSSLYMTQIPKTDLFTFINNIGGGLGLFMGIAFPNIIEFLQFITEIFLITFNL